MVADSSSTKHQFINPCGQCTHLYTPNLTYTQKIEVILKEVKTPYVVMCADDDFIIEEAVLKCVSFLDEHPDFTVAQGTCIKYNKASIQKQKVEFELLYPPVSFDNESAAPLERLEKMFENYRSVLYAVHRTEVLRKAFKNAATAIKNLYLNEYLTAVVPIIAGKYKELPCLYQIREHAEDSDDKITDNLDAILGQEKYRSEKEAFIELLTANSAAIISESKEHVRRAITEVLSKFAASPLIAKPLVRLTLKKRVGLFIKKLPLVGAWVVEQSRRLERSHNLKAIVKTSDDKKHLFEIEMILKKYADHKGD